MKTLRVAALALGLLALVAVPGEAQFENMGTIEFPTSATGEAQDHFLRGVTIMHLYGWAQAIEEFQAAQAIDPDFAMAYWAESLAYRRALAPRWGPAVQSREVLQRLAPTPEERLAKAPTAREKGFFRRSRCCGVRPTTLTGVLDTCLRWSACTRPTRTTPR